MKRLTLLLLLASTFTFAQEAASEKNELQTTQTAESNGGFKFHPMARFHVSYPITFGNNAYHKAHNPVVGFGTSLSLFSFNNFRFGIGYEYMLYEVTDDNLVGPFDNSKYSSFYGLVSYTAKLADKTTLYPEVGIGYAKNKLGSNVDRYGHQDGVVFRGGVNTGFRVARKASFYVGAHFLYSKFSVNTNAAYEKFYSNSSQLQFVAGFQID